MTFKDLSSFLDDDALEVPVNGKVYRIASPDAETGLRLAALANLGHKAANGGQISPADLSRLRLDDEQERDWMRDILGGTLDELIADSVPWVKIQRLSRYVFTYFGIGPEAADLALANGTLMGEAPAPAPPERRPVSRAGATTTKARVSTAGTTSARKRKPRPKGAR